MTKFGTVMQVRRRVISRVQPRPSPKGAGRQRHQNCWDPSATPKRFDPERRNLVC